MSRPPVSPNESVRLRRQARAIERLKRRGPETWVYVGSYPTDLYTTPDSPPWQNSWTHALGTYDRVAFRWDEQYRLEFKGVATGGASGTVAFTLPANWRPDKDLPFPTVDPVSNRPALLYVTAFTGTVKLTVL